VTTTDPSLLLICTDKGAHPRIVLGRWSGFASERAPNLPDGTDEPLSTTAGGVPQGLRRDRPLDAAAARVRVKGASRTVHLHCRRCRRRTQIRADRLDRALGVLGEVDISRV